MTDDTFQFGKPEEFAKLIQQLTERTLSLANDFLSKQDTTKHFNLADPDVRKASEAVAAQMSGIISEQIGKDFGTADPFNLTEAFSAFYNHIMANPERLVQAQIELWQDYANLWSTAVQRAMGEEPKDIVEAPRGDRRFSNELWDESPVHSFLKQSYLLTARHIEAFIDETKGLDEKTAHKVSFFTKQFVDALSPSNFVLTNPEVLQETIQSKGENLVKGVKNMLADYDIGRGQLAIKMTDLKAFKVGKNVATTKGQVVFQNKLIQLIQYEPNTKDVYKTPLLIIPPWINKYYILDLTEENSFVKWATDQGHTVFLISWVNPDEKFKDYDFDDYMFEGPLAALDAIKDATGESDVNAIGYCIGGTLLSGLLAYMKAKKDDRIKSATFFTALIDFSEPGDLGVFIDDEQITNLTEKMNKTGYLDGADMAISFNMLRSNDLIWSFVINNYLMGKDPFPFDLLYWNSDPVRLPAKLHSNYLRKMYLENKFKEPGGLTFGGVKIDHRTITTPSFFISTKSDHIAPWHSTYEGAKLFSGPVTFCLAASGHIAGVVNPPAKRKYAHWLNTKDKKLPAKYDTWFSNATEYAGSWWPKWADWLSKQTPEKVPAKTAGRKPGSGKLTALEPAPGSYVKLKA